MTEEIIPTDGLSVTLTVTKEGWTWRSWKDGEQTGIFVMERTNYGASGTQKGLMNDNLVPSKLGYVVDESCESGTLAICQCLEDLEL